MDKSRAPQTGNVRKAYEICGQCIKNMSQHTLVTLPTTGTGMRIRTKGDIRSVPLMNANTELGHCESLPRDDRLTTEQMTT